MKTKKDYLQPVFDAHEYVRTIETEYSNVAKADRLRELKDDIKMFLSEIRYNYGRKKENGRYETLEKWLSGPMARYMRYLREDAFKYLNECRAKADKKTLKMKAKEYSFIKSKIERSLTYQHGYSYVRVCVEREGEFIPMCTHPCKGYFNKIVPEKIDMLNRIEFQVGDIVKFEYYNCICEDPVNWTEFTICDSEGSELCYKMGR